MLVMNVRVPFKLSILQTDMKYGMKNKIVQLGIKRNIEQIVIMGKSYFSISPLVTYDRFQAEHG